MSAPTVIDADVRYDPLDQRARPSRRRPTVVEVGQLVCALSALVGLFMIVPLGWFLLIVGAVGLGLFWAVEHFASAPPSKDGGT